VQALIELAHDLLADNADHVASRSTIDRSGR
jgi:hypothetical protein